MRDLKQMISAKEHASAIADELLLAAYSEGISRDFHEDQAFRQLVKLVDALGWKLPAPARSHANA